MNDFSTVNYEGLKTSVLLNAGLAAISPLACIELKQLIFSKVHLHLGLVTLQQVFGLADSKFDPSEYTLNTMAAYCGSGSWKSWCSLSDQSIANKSLQAKQLNLTGIAKTITNFTIQALELKYPTRQSQAVHNVSGQIKKLISENPVTVLFSPEEAENRLGLCNWMMEAIKEPANNITLFFSGNASLSVFLIESSLSQRILATLGFADGDDIPARLDKKSVSDEMFYLVIEGLNEENFSANQFTTLLDDLAGIAMMYKSRPWFKMILTMHLSTWLNNDRIRALGDNHAG